MLSDIHQITQKAISQS